MADCADDICPQVACSRHSICLIASVDFCQAPFVNTCIAWQAARKSTSCNEDCTSVQASSLSNIKLSGDMQSQVKIQLITLATRSIPISLPTKACPVSSAKAYIEFCVALLPKFAKFNLKSAPKSKNSHFCFKQ